MTVELPEGWEWVGPVSSVLGSTWYELTLEGEHPLGAHPLSIHALGMSRQIFAQVQTGWRGSCGWRWSLGVASPPPIDSGTVTYTSLSECQQAALEAVILYRVERALLDLAT
jgi:hypothetical protein